MVGAASRVAGLAKSHLTPECGLVPLRARDAEPQLDEVAVAALTRHEEIAWLPVARQALIGSFRPRQQATLGDRGAARLAGLEHASSAALTAAIDSDPYRF